MEDNEITNFGYVILLDGKPNLSILLDNNEIFNDITIDSDENIYNVINNREMYIVGVTILDDNNIIFNANELTDDNVSKFNYTITPLHIYKVKTYGLIMEDFIDLELINTLFFNILDDYIKERIS